MKRRRKRARRAQIEREALARAARELKHRTPPAVRDKVLDAVRVILIGARR